MMIPDNIGYLPLMSTKKRAGYTTNKGHGQSKQRRRMVKESRRRNRRR
jgi:hypothetical protein